MSDLHIRPLNPDNRIRRMSQEDADAVRQVDAIAFGALWKQWGGGSGAERTNEETFCALLSASQALARTCGKQELKVRVNACHVWALEHLLQWGYRVERTMARMILKGTDAGASTDGYVDCSGWMG